MELIILFKHSFSFPNKFLIYDQKKYKNKKLSGFGWLE